MKIIKTKEDTLNGVFWCYATRENYEALQKLGITNFGFDSFDCYEKDEDYKSNDVFNFGGMYRNIVNWYSYENREGQECSFDYNTYNTYNTKVKTSLSIKDFGFQEPEWFTVELFKVCENGIIGVVNYNTPAMWNFDGTCINPSSGYSLYKEYKQRIYTKKNSPGWNPKYKFKFSWTEKMSLQLEQSGWRRVTNEEIESFKDI